MIECNSNEDVQNIASQFLHKIRCGEQPVLIEEPYSGWEICLSDVAISLEHPSAKLILWALVNGYQRLSATFGNPNVGENYYREARRD